MLSVRKVGRLALCVGAALVLVQATAAPAQAALPYGEGVYAKVDGALHMPVVILGPGVEHVFPTGGPGQCDPGGHQPNFTGKVGRKGGKGHASLTQVAYDYAAGDVWAQEDGVICGKLSLQTSKGGIGGKKPSSSRDGSVPFKLTNVTAQLEIIGYGVFAPHIPEGCSLSLKIGTLKGTMSVSGPPNAATLSAGRVHIAKASPDKCGVNYSHLLNIGFGLPANHASLSLDLTVYWGPDQGNGTSTTTTAPPVTTTTTTTVPATTTTAHDHDH